MLASSAGKQSAYYPQPSYYYVDVNEIWVFNLKCLRISLLSTIASESQTDSIVCLISPYPNNPPETFNLVSDSGEYFNYFKYISFFPAKQAMRVDMLYTNKLNNC